MFAALITTITIALAKELPKVLNYPGFEAWKFLNLFIFVVLLVYILRRPISEAFRTKRDGIRQALMKAQEERDAAIAKLKEVENRLSKLDEEVSLLRENARREAAEEQERIARLTEAEAEKLRDQARREIENAGKVAKQDLRRYAAEQSVRFAEDIIRGEIKPEDDSRLFGLSVDEMGGVRR
jgi:F0F1-type ATP synthase membrane subunit b/b'